MLLASGAVNDGLDVVAPDNVTGGPAVCVHAYVMESSSGSVDSVPSRVTGSPR